jgi:hypothetical protein
MHSKRSKILLSIAAAAVLAVPAGASAKQGADDPPGHVRHGKHVTGAKKQSVKHSSRSRSDDRGRDDDRGRGRGRGSDDGPNHT